MTTTRATPNTTSAIYKAAAAIDANGPHMPAALFEAVDFGVEHARQDKLDHAIEIGWLRQTASGAIDLTEESKRHFDRKRPKAYVGQITPPQYRPNVFASPGLSKRFIPSRRGQRNDIPAWSVKPDGHSIKSIGGGEA